LIWDAAVNVLVVSLIVAVLVAILMHLHFKQASDARLAVVDPLVFALTGVLIGISVGMIWFRDESTEWGRISIERGLTHAVAGAVVGGLAGVGAKAVFGRLGRTKAIVVALTLMLLAASVGAPVGWLYGSVSAKNAYEAEQLSRSGMIWGIAIGCVVGFALGLFEACFGDRLRKGDPVATNTKNGVS